VLYLVLVDTQGWGLAPCASFYPQGETLLQEQTPGTTAKCRENLILVPRNVTMYLEFEHCNERGL